MSTRHGYNVKALRLQCWKRQRGHCYFCDAVTWLPVDGKPADPLMATLEHLVDLDLGGSWHGSNLACSCLGCNSKRAQAKQSARNGQRDLIARYSAPRRRARRDDACNCGDTGCDGMQCQRIIA